MRQAGTLPDERLARRFADYLLTLGIESRMDAGPGGCDVWIYDEGRLTQAVQELAVFREQPDDPRFASAAAAAEAIRREKVAAEQRFRKNYVDLRRRWDPRVAGARSLTFVLIACSALVSLLTSFGEQHGPVMNALLIAPVVQAEDFIRWNHLDSLQHGEIWRAVTPIFIHFGIVHLLFNSIWLAQLGGLIEARWGAWWMLFLVLALAIPSNLAQYYHSGPMFGGMSGVVYGLLGYVWMKSRYDPQAGFYIPQSTIVWALGWYVLCLTGSMGPIANVAHSVGLGLGALLGYAPTIGRAWRR